MKPSNLIIFLGRDDWRRDESLSQLLYAQFMRSPVKVAWEDRAAGAIYRLKNYQQGANWMPGWLKGLSLRLLQLGYGLLHPSYWRDLYQRKRATIDTRCDQLRKTVGRYQSGYNITVIARSSGCIVATKVADELGLEQVICLGYPFMHPQRGDEPERYRHLEILQTPTVIIQGANDQYGGKDIRDRYRFSDNIEVVVLETDHDFGLTDADRSVLYRLLGGGK